MTPFPRARYDGGSDGGLLIPGVDRNDYDFERLERAVGALVGGHEQLLVENAKLRRELRECDRRIRQLDEQILGANQRRHDVGKHVDELIAQIDQLDAQFESQEEM